MASINKNKAIEGVGDSISEINNINFIDTNSIGFIRIFKLTMFNNLVKELKTRFFTPKNKLVFTKFREVFIKAFKLYHFN